MKHFCGLDFGTSNSILYLIEKEHPEHSVVISEPSVIFMSKNLKQGNKGVFVGDQAVTHYISERMEGRFIQSVKALLPNDSFNYTEIHGAHFHAVDLVAIIIKHLKDRAEKQIGYELEDVVMGRPVFFSTRQEEDQLAQRRLEQAARIAGFKNISFQFEPIGAALAYEQDIKISKRVLVADFGGGTTDFTVMKLDPNNILKPNRVEDILATGGVYIGGESFDSRIMWNELISFFGYGTQFESMFKRFDIPDHFFKTLCNWYHIHHLKEDSHRLDLKDIYFGAVDKQAVKRLMTLIDEDLGYALFRSIQEAKHILSSEGFSQIIFSQSGIQISHPLLLSRFNDDIEQDILEIEKELEATLRKADLKHSDIDSVFITGGTSQVRSIQELFRQHFMSEQLNQDDNLFQSVAKGLSLSQRYL